MFAITQVHLANNVRHTVNNDVYRRIFQNADKHPVMMSVDRVPSYIVQEKYDASSCSKVGILI